MQLSGSIPADWALNERGEPTTDPEEALKGILLPFGQHKGYGMTFAISALTAILSGGAFDEEVKSVDIPSQHQNISHFFIALNRKFFQSSELFKQRMNYQIDKIHMCTPTPGTESIYYPGERGFIKKQELIRKEEIDINTRIWKELSELAR